MKYDVKSHFGELKDLDLKGRRVSMYLSSFGNLDSDGDIIFKGAYAKSISERKDQIFFLNQHNWAQPHGKFDELVEDEFGLYAVSNKMVDTSYSMDALKLYEAGIMKEHSVGFNVVKADYDRETDVRHIKEIKLYEGSNVTLGANSMTPFQGFKSMDKKEVDAELKKFLKAFRNGDFTDETFGLLEIAIQQLMKQSAELAVHEYKNHSEPTLITQEPIVNESEILNNYLKKWN